MCISNAMKAEISYAHKDKIQRLFNSHVRGNLNIDHFSLNLFFGDGQSIFLSPTPQMAEELCKHNFVDEDSNYKSEIYKNLSVYPWRAVQKNQADRVINFIKEERFGMRSGMMIVRDLGEDRFVMYSIATYKKDNIDFPGQFYFLFHCKANYIAQMGDFMYESLLTVINKYTHQEGIHMPNVRNMKPIDLKSSLQSDEQKEMLEIIQSGTNVNISKIIKRRRKIGPLLKLIDGGKVER